MTHNCNLGLERGEAVRRSKKVGGERKKRLTVLLLRPINPPVAATGRFTKRSQALLGTPGLAQASLPSTEYPNRPV